MSTGSSEEKDYLLRIIKQAAEALRRMRNSLNKSADSGPAVRQEARGAIEQLLGTEAQLFARLDAETAVRLVGDRSRADLWTELLDLDAAACDSAGDNAAGTANRARAAALRAATDRLFTAA